MITFVMETHPVPSNVTSFEFHLVGDMTLRQFVYLAAGLGIAYLTFVLLFSRVPILAVPIIGISSLLGAAFAFLPILDRPLDHWVKAFFRAVYSPTKGVWQLDGQQNNSEDLVKTRLQIYLSSMGIPVPVMPVTPAPMPMPIPKTSPQLTRLKIEPPQAIQPKLVAPMPIIQTQVPQPIAKVPPGPRISLTSFPNVINGIVSDVDGNYMENVIVIIRSKDNIPVRALKTNKLGQFTGASPLPIGVYTVTPEKDGFIFDNLQVTLNDEILQPINVHPKTK